MKIRHLLGMAVLGLMAAACSNDVNDVLAPEAPQKGIHFTATIAPKIFDATTRALTEATDDDGKTYLTASWDGSESFALVYEVGDTKYVYRINEPTLNSDGSLTLKTNLSDPFPESGASVTLVYPASIVDNSGTIKSKENLVTQQGTIDKVPDHRIGTGTLSITGSEATLAESVDMKAQNAIVGFSIKDIMGENDLNPDIFTIRRADDGLIAMVTYSQSFCYIALPPSSAETWFKALTSVDGKTQTYIAKGTAKLEAGKYYPTELKMATVGDVILSTGKFAAPGTSGARAMIAYLGNAFAGGDGEATTTHGLAIALERVNEDGMFWDGSDDDGKTAAEVVAYWAEDHGVTGGNWRLPSTDDWKYMFQGCGGDDYKSELTDRMTFHYGDFITLWEAATGTESEFPLEYWSSTEGDGDDAWNVTIERQEASFYLDPKDRDYWVLAVLAF